MSVWERHRPMPVLLGIRREMRKRRFKGAVWIFRGTFRNAWRKRKAAGLNEDREMFPWGPISLQYLKRKAHFFLSFPFLGIYSENGYIFCRIFCFFVEK